MNFKLWLENENEDKIKSLGQQLKHLDQQKYSILGHGTTKQTAENILKTGLRYSDPNLDRQTIPLFDSESPIQNQTNNLNSILNWKHKNSKAIVLIGIPNPKEDERGGEQHFQSVWDEIPKEKLTDFHGNPTDKNSFKYIIKPEYIMGYVDANNATFHTNPNFNPPPLNTKNKWWLEPPSLPQQSNRKIIPMPQLNTPTTQYSDPNVW